MKKLFFYNGKPEVLDIPTPTLEPETILIKTAYSFVSRGTELKTLQNNKYSLLKKTFENFSAVLKKVTSSLAGSGINSTVLQVKSQILKKLDIGYSVSGVVVESNSKNFRVGDLVACAGFGFAGHAQYCMVPANLAVKVKNKDFLKQSSAAAIGAIALQALRRADLKIGETLCVFGVGLIGLILVQLAKLSGLKVFCVDTDLAALQKAKDFGADQIFCSQDQHDWITSLILSSGNFGVDAVILAASSEDPDLINQAVNICRKKGKIIIVGDFPLIFSRESFYKKELDLLISCSYGPGRYDEEFELHGVSYPFAYVRWTETRNLQLIADLICDKALNIDELVLDTFNLVDAQKAYDELKKNNLSVIFSYPDEVASEQENASEAPFIAPAKLLTDKKNKLYDKEILDCSLVGAGAFAKTMLAPILTRLQLIKLKSVFDVLPTSSLHFKETFGFESMASSFAEILQDSSVDMLVIASPAKSHTEQALLGLQHGKAVFCEKPMITSYEELLQIKDFLQENPKAFFAVDFNRSFAPMMSLLADKLQSRYSPLLINYRVNAGLLCMHADKQSFYSRIVGEICHFFELFLALVKANPTKLVVACSGSGHEIYEENMSISLVFEDGSITNLFYSSLANLALGKERAEFFWDKKSVVLDDFKSLVCYGFSKSFDQYSLVPDKGHAAVLSNFVFSVKKNDNTAFSALWDRYLLVSWLTLKTEELLFKNGGTIDLNCSKNSFAKEVVASR